MSLISSSGLISPDTKHIIPSNRETVKPIFDDSNWVYIEVSSGGFIGGSGGSLEPPSGTKLFPVGWGRGGSVVQRRTPY